MYTKSNQEDVVLGAKGYGKEIAYRYRQRPHDNRLFSKEILRLKQAVIVTSAATDLTHIMPAFCRQSP